ncbi:MAG TPA: hypothetical protein VNA65_09205, partial [Candidatus Dormibacteraeota bacterium]|nr:hypothetical protein [Candidatus Dormibacteraeota bacterium]
RANILVRSLNEAYDSLSRQRERLAATPSIMPTKGWLMEKESGALRAGKLCDLTIVDGDRVTATVVGGRVSWQRKPA